VAGWERLLKKREGAESTLNNQLRRKHCLLGHVRADKEARVGLCLNASFLYNELAIGSGPLTEASSTI
jgi:hypothetical protein